jgi:hypothetical protein
VGAAVWIRLLAAAGCVLGALLSPPGTAQADPDPALPNPPGPPPGPLAVPQSVIEADGTYPIGSVLAPGVYASAGPRDGGTCYWRRIGAQDTTLNNALTKQPQTVLIEASDVAFKTDGCQPWALTGGPPPAQSPPWLSQLQLRHQLDVLNGLAGRSGNGQLPPY